MQSSYKIIKNVQIAYGQKGVPVAEVKLDNYKKQEIIENEPEVETVEEIQETEPVIDIEEIKAEIREQLRQENEKEKQSLISKTMMELNKEADRVKQEALEIGYKEGLKAGYKKGIEDCKEECNQMKSSAISLLGQAQDEVKAYYKESKEKIIKLAGDMAESIVHTTIDLSSENILLLIEPIIQLYEGNENIIITTSPTNAGFLKSKLSELEELKRGTRFIILEDSNLDKNNCIIENENQIVDLQIKKQINSIINDIRTMED